MGYQTYPTLCIRCGGGQVYNKSNVDQIWTQSYSQITCPAPQNIAKGRSSIAQIYIAEILEKHSQVLAFKLPKLLHSPPGNPAPFLFPFSIFFWSLSLPQCALSAHSPRSLANTDNIFFSWLYPTDTPTHTSYWQMYLAQGGFSSYWPWLKCARPVPGLPYRPF